MSSMQGTPDASMRRLLITDRSLKIKFLADVSVLRIALKDKYHKSKFILCATNGMPITT